MSKSKLFSVIIFLGDVVYFLSMEAHGIVHAILMILSYLIGLALVWIGHGLGAARLRASAIPIWLELIGWIILIRPVLRILFNLIFGG